MADPATTIGSVEALERLFEAPSQRSLVKERDRIEPPYAAMIAASPFAVLATAGPEGLDCSPRGDAPGFVRIRDERTLVLPERRGNNRIDSLRNIVRDPRVALLFLIPGIGETLRVNGRAHLSTDPALLEPEAVDGRLPKLAIVIAVEQVFFQCSRSVMRAGLWDPARHVGRAAVPTPGQILDLLSQGGIDGTTYDRELRERLSSTLY